MRFEHGLGTIPHCLEWYKLVLRTHLPTLAVRYLVHTAHFFGVELFYCSLLSAITFAASVSLFDGLRKRLMRKAKGAF